MWPSALVLMVMIHLQRTAGGGLEVPCCWVTHVRAANQSYMHVMHLLTTPAAVEWMVPAEAVSSSGAPWAASPRAAERAAAG